MLNANENVQSTSTKQLPLILARMETLYGVNYCTICNCADKPLSLGRQLPLQQVS
jgi:hypothetical protein